MVALSALTGPAEIGFARRGQYRRWLASALTPPTLLSLLVAFLLYPVIYPATGLTVREAVISPLALWHFKFRSGVFSGPVVDESYGP